MLVIEGPLLHDPPERTVRVRRAIHDHCCSRRRGLGQLVPIQRVHERPVNANIQEVAGTHLIRASLGQEVARIVRLHLDRAAIGFRPLLLNDQRALVGNGPENDFRAPGEQVCQGCLLVSNHHERDSVDSGPPRK